jgi:peptidoglycan/xylan/chitin deacetylase (PgdA/CDA1 family)
MACSIGRSQVHGIRSLVYHSVSSRDARSSDEMSISTDLFETHMRILREHDMVVCDASSVVDKLRSGVALEPRSVVLTFDDGLRDFYETAYPILRRFGYPATVFLIAGALETESGTRWHRWPGGYMTTQQVRELQQDGLVRFGCHGVTHAPLTQLPDDALEEEIVGSRARLEAVLGAPVELLAYPYGVREMWDDRVPRAVEHAGFRGAYTSVFGVDGVGSDVYRLRRSRVSWAVDPVNFGRLLRGCYDWYARYQELQTRLLPLIRV